MAASLSWLCLLASFVFYLCLQFLFLAEVSQPECPWHPRSLDLHPHSVSNTCGTVNLVHAMTSANLNLASKSARPHVVCLLLDAGDTSRNPGPRHLCPRCSRELNNRTVALQCDKCDSWVHRKCELLSLAAYRRLSASFDKWHCGACTTRWAFQTVTPQQPMRSSGEAATTPWDPLD